MFRKSIFVKLTKICRAVQFLLGVDVIQPHFFWEREVLRAYRAVVVGPLEVASFGAEVDDGVVEVKVGGVVGNLLLQTFELLKLLVVHLF
jgi:hypothetical protein